MKGDSSRLVKEEAWLLKEKHNGYQSFDYIVDRERLRRGEPLAYIIGWVPFASCKIWLDSYPLIPRPETEFWVEKAIEEIQNYTSQTSIIRGQTPKYTLRVLDLCAGSGCIGIAIAKAIAVAHVDFAEIDTSHYPTIGKSVAENHINRERVRVFGGDLFSDVPKNETYDVIVSNPPYIDPAHDRTDESVHSHEPHRALYGGRGGLEIIERIIKELPAHLRRAGRCYIEHEPEQADALRELAAQNGLTCEAHKDQYGITRYSKLGRQNVRK